MLSSLITWLDRNLISGRLAVSSSPWGDQINSSTTPAFTGDAQAWFGDVMACTGILGRQGIKSALRRFVELRTLRHAPFDQQFYLSQLVDRPAKFDAIRHYVTKAYNLDKDPTPYFNNQFYLKSHRDVAAAGINPYVHFLTRGHLEGRRFEPSNFGTGRPANYLHVEDWHTVPWPMRDSNSDLKGLYSQRPDDAVILASRSAEAFIRQYGLDGPRPDFKAASASLNALNLRPSEGLPDVTIVIPVYGQLAYTLICLHALLNHVSRYSFEVLIGDDASPDETEEWLKNLSGIRYFRHERNLGFIGNCNATALHARGRHLVLLNNDTHVVDGWLDALIDSFTSLPAPGLVGSKLFYPDGSLQEAGGIVWRDGSAWNYGRNDDPNRPRYCHARQVDYVSGCSIALSKELWRQLGGFDTHFSPAYYEDTDLAFRVRQSGLTVWMQPLSRVIHYEGKTSGTDLSSGAKAYQVENQKKFFLRWKDVLATHRENGAEPWLERQRPVHRFALVIDTLTPTPDRDAGSAATAALIRSYQQLGFQVLFLPEDNFLYDPKATQQLQKIGVECLYAPYETSLSEILRRYAPYIDVIQTIRPLPAQNVLEVLAREKIVLPVLYLNADLHFLRLQRQAEIEDRPELLRDAAEMKAIELDILRRVDGTFVHSTFELELLAKEVPEACVAILPLVHDCPGSQTEFQERLDIIFLGGFNHPPNLDAAIWFIDDIWPRTTHRYPNARLLIVGANPPANLLKRASDRILITGHVEDLSPWFERARVFVAPLRFGAGAKGKIVSALAHGVPVVATPLAVEGMGFDAGKTGFVAATANEIAQSIEAVYDSGPVTWGKFSQNAINVAANNFSQSAMTEALKAMVAHVTYFDMYNNIDVMKLTTEEMAIDSCLSGLKG